MSESAQSAQVVPVNLKPFTAEEKASFDLIVGFTKSMNFVKYINNPDDRPTLTAVQQGRGRCRRDGRTVPPDRPRQDDRSNARLPPALSGAGRRAGHQGDLLPQAPAPAKAPVRSGRPGQLHVLRGLRESERHPHATLRQIAIRADTDEENDDEVANRGIITRSKSAAIIEAMVTAGSPVRNVTVTGNYQKIEVNGGPITSPALTFLDDGAWPDTTQGDGVYTAKITLDPQERRKQAIYQVLIEAQSSDKTAFVPTETFKKPPDTPAANSPTTRSRRAMAPKPPEDNPPLPAVPKFQRATSVNFLVEGVKATS